MEEDLTTKESSDARETSARELVERYKKELLELQFSLSAVSAQITRAEVLSLIAHDLGHRAFSISRLVDELGRLGSKFIEPQFRRAQFEEVVSEAKSTSQSFEAAIHRIALLSSNRENLVEFSLSSTVNEVFETLDSSLSRFRINTDVGIPHDIQLFGDRSVIQQVFYNLIANSIQAQNVNKGRRNLIRIRAKVESISSDPFVRVIYSDEGPGIDRRRFPDPNQIFELGKSSKEGATGIGLSVCRSLLTGSFRADLNLVSASPAVFEMKIPLTKKSYPWQGNL